MAVSRLRIRLASGFALAFALGLAVLALGALGYLWRESNRRLDARLDGIAMGVVAGIHRELNETPDSSLAFVGQEVVSEWPRNGDAFVIADASGRVVAALDQDSAAARVLVAAARERRAWFNVESGGPDLRARSVDTTLASRSVTARAHVIAFGSTEGIESDTELFGLVFVVSAPIIVLLSLVAGYVLAGRALSPMRDLAASISAIAPTDLSRRLTTSGARDEVSSLTLEFNALLDRLDDAQRRNRQFVREAAHQIRTPLTLVLGEAGHALSTDNGNPDRMQATLGRIRTAAEQMRRRVDELFLLAEARSGEPVRLEQVVELDGLLLECTDLMRARAMATGHSLAIETADPVAVQGNGALLQEALLELLENACRHGDPGTTVTVSCSQAGASARVEVESRGVPFTLPPADARAERGMGLSIVRWVVQSHHGTMAVTHRERQNRVILDFPLALPVSGTPGTD